MNSCDVFGFFWQVIILSFCHLLVQHLPQTKTKQNPLTRSRCPGTHLVESSIWLLITSMLATLDIRKARDEKGVEIEPVVKFENAVFRWVSFFLCLFFGAVAE